MNTSLDIATAPRAASKEWKRSTITWAEVCAWVAEPRTGAKDGQGYVLGRLSSSRRKNETIESRCVLALDADHLTPAKREGLLVRLRALGCAAVIYTTHGSTPAAPRLRVLVLALHPIDPDEYRVVIMWLMEQLGADLFDPTCAEPARFMYMPTRPAVGDFYGEVLEGEAYDVDEALMLADLVRLAEKPSPVLFPVVAGERTPTSARLPEHVVRGAIGWALGKLDVLASLVDGDRADWPGHPDGVGWDRGTFLAAQRLVEAANSGAGYTLAEAEADFMDHAPAAEGTYTPGHKWESAVAATGSQPLPYEDPADVFAPVQSGPFLRTSLRALLDPNRPPREWVIEGLLLAGTANAFIAPAGARKSLVTLAVSLAVACGDGEWAGMTIPRARRVCYVDMENTEDDLRERLLSFGVTEDVENFILLSMPAMKPLDTAAGGVEFLAALDAFGMQPGDLVSLDSYQRITEAGENDSDTTRAFYRHTGIGLKQRGLTVIRTDNTGKDTARGARGSSGKRDDVDVEYLIKSTGDLIEFTPGKARQGGIEGLTVRVATLDGRTTFHGKHGTVFQADVDTCIAWLDERNVDPAMGLHAVKKQVGERFTRVVVKAAIDQRRERSEDFS